MTGSNRRPSACKADALPAELILRIYGADNETRTRDPDLGKVVLYQLSYVRLSGEESKVMKSAILCP